MKTMRLFLFAMAVFFLCLAAQAEDREITLDERSWVSQALLDQGADPRLYTELRHVSPDGAKLSCDNPEKFEIRRLQPGIYWLANGATVDQKRLARCLGVENQLFGKGKIAQTAPLVTTNVTAPKPGAVASTPTSKTVPASKLPSESGVLFVDSPLAGRPFVVVSAPDYVEPEQSVLVTWKAGQVDSITFNDGIQVISNLPLEGTAVRKISESRNFTVEARARNGEIIRGVRTVRIKPIPLPPNSPAKTTGLETGLVLALAVAVFGVLCMGVVAGYFLGSSLRAPAPPRADASSEPPDPEQSWPYHPALMVVNGGGGRRPLAQPDQIASDPIPFVEMAQSQTTFCKLAPVPFSSEAIRIMSTPPEQTFWEAVRESGIGGVMGNCVCKDRNGRQYVAFNHNVEDGQLDALIAKLESWGFSPQKEVASRIHDRFKYKVYLMP